MNAPEDLRTSENRRRAESFCDRRKRNRYSSLSKITERASAVCDGDSGGKTILDYPAAKALATEVISVKPFGRIEEKEIQKAKEWIKKCDKVICTLDVEKAGSLQSR